MTGMSYDDLVSAAAVGLSRRQWHVTGLAGPAAEHAGVLDGEDPAAALLDAAALMVIARWAGARPASGITCPAPTAMDTAPELPARAADLLEQMRAGEPGLLADLLRAAGDAGYRAPAPMLPVLLDAAVKDRILRPAVAALLGGRGRWLAAHRSDWQQVADADPRAGPDVPDDPAVWETGSRGERRAYLAMLRDRDPAAARDLLAAGWSRETGDDRADLLAVLARGLSAADEEFLERALDDRKASVRATAGRLLAQLPGSAFTRRAAERAASLLRVERHGLRRRLVVSLPGAVDASAARDGIGTSPPSSALGAGAWGLTQLIAQAPLTEWVARFGMDAGQIVSLPVEGDLGVDVHAGWRLAAISQASPEWAEVLLAAGEPRDAARRPPSAWPPGHQLAAVLTPGARAARAAALLTRVTAASAAIAEVTSCPAPWPDSLADAVIATLRRTVISAARSRWPGELVTTAARCLPVTGRTDYAAGLVRLANAAPCLPPWSAALRRAAGIIALRRAFLEEIR
jgi:Family of unknown function (DUF5691)